MLVSEHDELIRSEIEEQELQRHSVRALSFSFVPDEEDVHVEPPCLNDNQSCYTTGGDCDLSLASKNSSVPPVVLLLNDTADREGSFKVRINSDIANSYEEMSLRTYSERKESVLVSLNDAQQ